MQAQEVTLRFADGSFEVTGPLLGFDGQDYRVDTRFGVLTLSADAVICDGDCPSEDNAPRVRMAGSPAMAEVLMPALVDAFARSLGLTSRPVQLPDGGGIGLALATSEGAELARFEIRAMTTSEAFEAMADFEADIALADRDINEGERARLLDVGLGDVAKPMRRRLVARRILRLIVPSDFDAPSLAVSDLLRAASGGAAWSDFGGPELPVAWAAEPVDGQPGLARLRELADLIGVEADFGDFASLASAEEIVSYLQGVPGAVALTHETIFSGRPVSLSHGCEAGSADRATGDAHPLMVHLWAYTAEPRLPDLGRSFLVFAGGPEAQRVVDRAGFIDQRPRPLSLASQGDRIARAVEHLSEELALKDLQEAISRLRPFDRLTTVFRFQPGTPQLSRESENEAQSLAAVLDSGRFDGRELLFLALTDSVGDAALNKRLSQSRAERALAEVQGAMVTRNSRVTMTAEGAGELFPLACDDTAWGQHVNRRVEVWIGPAP